MYFWRDNTGNEIDLLVDDSGAPDAIEIKSVSHRITSKIYFTGTKYQDIPEGRLCMTVISFKKEAMELLYCRLIKFEKN